MVDSLSIGCYHGWAVSRTFVHITIPLLIRLQSVLALYVPTPHMDSQILMSDFRTEDWPLKL